MSPENNPLPDDFPEEEGLSTTRWPWTQVYAVFPELAAFSSSQGRQAEWVPQDLTRGGSEACAAFSFFQKFIRLFFLFVCLFHFLDTVSSLSFPSPFHHALFPLPSLSQGSPAAAGDHPQHLSFMLVTRKRAAQGKMTMDRKEKYNWVKARGHLAVVRSKEGK